MIGDHGQSLLAVISFILSNKKAPVKEDKFQPGAFRHVAPIPARSRSPYKIFELSGGMVPSRSYSSPHVVGGLTKRTPADLFNLFIRLSLFLAICTPFLLSTLELVGHRVNYTPAQIATARVLCPPFHGVWFCSDDFQIPELFPEQFPASLVFCQVRLILQARQVLIVSSLSVNSVASDKTLACELLDPSRCDAKELRDLLACFHWFHGSLLVPCPRPA